MGLSIGYTCVQDAHANGKAAFEAADRMLYTIKQQRHMDPKQHKKS